MKNKMIIWFTALFILSAVFSNTVALAAEREYGTYIVLGQGLALGSSEGLGTPLVILDHESSGYFGNGTLRLKYETVSPTLSMTHRFEGILDFEYAVYGTAIAEGNGTDLYKSGELQKSKTFAGDGISTMLAVHLFPEKPARLSLTADSRQRKFYNSKLIEEGSTYSLPDRFSESTTTAVIKWVGLLHEDGEISATQTQGARSNYKNWQLETDADSKAEFSKTTLALKDSFEWDKMLITNVKVSSASGTNLDLFSNIKVGGMTSQYSVAGYFRNEFRVSSAQLLKLNQEIKFADDRIMYVFADLASFTNLELDYLGTSGKSHSISGAGIGYRYGIRSLGGLPIIVNYGHGFNVSETSKEQSRQELVFVVAAAF
ncbi:MAG: hypothetical protein H8E38_13900 [SAR324 cluster bacterium]|nr:hypothetical protein [SAR324 cluster bacterium]